MRIRLLMSMGRRISEWFKFDTCRRIGEVQRVGCAYMRVTVLKGEAQELIDITKTVPSVPAAVGIFQYYQTHSPNIKFSEQQISRRLKNVLYFMSRCFCLITVASCMSVCNALCSAVLVCMFFASGFWNSSI